MPKDAEETRRALREAALRLFVERGFEPTTAADIASSVGVTERTFFRHFADKRDVLFTPQEVFEAPFLDAVASAPDNNPRSLIEAALGAGADAFRGKNREWSRARQSVLDKEPRLAERELSKHAELAASLAVAFEQRGFVRQRAALAAEVTALAFRVGFDRWMGADDDRALLESQRQVLADLEWLVSPGAAA